jgi:hypothetical protein
MNNDRILGLEALARHCENLLATEKIKKKLEEDFVAGRRNGDDLALRRRMFSRTRAWLGDGIHFFEPPEELVRAIG